MHLPLVTALRNPGLRDRHWERISAAAGFPVRADAGFSVSRALQLGLPKHLPAIEEVAEYASKEVGAGVRVRTRGGGGRGPPCPGC